MGRTKHIIRLAAAGDSESMLKIYAPYVTDTAVSFETEVPSAGEFAARIEAIGRQYPFLIYLIDGETAGYAYASKHRERAAYRYDVELSIYVSPSYHGHGVAHRLYGCLFAILRELGYCNAYAAYTLPNDKSGRFHEKTGFKVIGTHHQTGYKLGKWHDVVWMEKALNEHGEEPPLLKSIRDLPAGYLENLFLTFVSEET